MASLPGAVALALLLLICNVALGVPSLQLYSPGATYDDSSESWLTYDNPFELWVVGARTPELIHWIDQLSLFVSIPDQYWDDSLSPSLTIRTIASADPLAAEDKNPLADWTVTFDLEDMDYGTPTFGDGTSMPQHGEYPAHYWTIGLSDYYYLTPQLRYQDFDGPATLYTDNLGEVAYDFNSDFDPSDPLGGADAFGDLQYYEISYPPFAGDYALNIDIIGYAHNTWERWRFAAFSHDVSASTPEPASIALLCVALASLAFKRTGRANRRRD